MKNRSLKAPFLYISRYFDKKSLDYDLIELRGFLRIKKILKLLDLYFIILFKKYSLEKFYIRY